jgi:hypothetical protein
MKNVQGIVFGIVWMIVILMIGYILVGQLFAHANDSGSLNGSAYTWWTLFVTFTWLGLGLLAFLPLIMVALMYGGLFGGGKGGF